RPGAAKPGLARSASNGARVPTAFTPTLVMLAAGVGIAVQGAVNGRLGQRIGVLPTVAFSTLISAVSLQLLLLVSGRSLATPYQAFRERPWLWLGGICG